MSSQAHRADCCPYYHQAVELIGRRWSGAILFVLLRSGRPLRFSEIAAAVPDLSDRLLSQRVKELEAHDLVCRRDGAYAVTDKGQALEPAILALQSWATRWVSL